MIGAVDIGGTKIAVGLVAEDGRILSQAVFLTEPERGFADGMQRIRATLAQQVEQAQVRLDGIGVGSTGPINPITGEIEKVHTLPGWQGNNLVQGLAVFGVPVALENDADAAALGEFAWGAGKGCSRFIYVTISTGIGSGVVLDGKLYRGLGGAHPEVGHHIVDPGGPACYCGARGCWESLASGVALADWFKRNHPDGSHHPPELEARAICELAWQGDAYAQKAVGWSAFYLGLGLANLVTLFVPEVIALGGGMMQSWALFEGQARQVLRENARLVPVEQVQIVPACLQSTTGLVGAAQAWIQRYA
jgi:glucokinase